MGNELTSRKAGLTTINLDLLKWNTRLKPRVWGYFRWWLSELPINSSVLTWVELHSDISQNWAKERISSLSDLGESQQLVSGSRELPAARGAKCEHKALRGRTFCNKEPGLGGASQGQDWAQGSGAATDHLAQWQARPEAKPGQNQRNEPWGSPGCCPAVM